MKLEGLFVTVNINLENGIYQFCCESATGKTRLYDIIKLYQRARYNVIAYSYTDLQDGLCLGEVINRIHSKLLLIDRYGMFDDMYHENILKVSENCIVLIDSKNVLTFNDYYTTCEIIMTPTNIDIVR